MNKTAIKSVAAFAVLLATTSVWADLTYTAPQTVTFDSLNESPGNVRIGSNTESDFASDWVVWKSSDGSTDYGFSGADWLEIGSTSGGSYKYGNLKIESGSYGQNTVHRFLVGYKGTGRLWMTGGELKAANNIYVGVGANASSVGYLNMDGGYLETGTDLVLGQDEATTGYMAVSNATVLVKGDFKVCNSVNGSGTFTVGEGGVVYCGASGTRKWTQLAVQNGSTGTINIDEGGTMYFSKINKGSGTGYLNFNGGTMIMHYAEGDPIITSGVNVTVGEKGGTIDTAGNAASIAATVGGTGTLTIAGGGTVTFTANPTCSIKVTGGTKVKFADGALPSITSDVGMVCIAEGQTPSNIVLGTGGFIEYDLTYITSDPGATQTLASRVTITTTDASAIAEHVVIRHGAEMADHEFHWNVTYENSALVATYEGDGTAAGNNATQAFTIYTGYEHSAATRPECWVNGYPTEQTKMIVPFDCEMCLWQNSVHCGDLVVNGDFTLSQRSNNDTRYKNFKAKSVTGSGTLKIAFPYTYGYLESKIGDDVPDAYKHATEIYVPVIVTGTPIMSGSETYPLNFNDSFTINSGATVTYNGDHDNYQVNLNGDVTVNGELTTRAKGLTIQSDKTLSGSGTVNGNVELSAGAAIGVGIDEAGACTNVLTVTGTANLANAAIEIDGGESLADAQIGAEVVLFRASTISNWTKKSVTIGGKPWKVVKGTETVGGTAYETLVATKAKCGLIIIVQ